MIPHYRTLVTSLLLFLSSTFAFAQDADEQYAKDLLKPGTEAPDFPLQSKRPNSSYKLSDFRTAYVFARLLGLMVPRLPKGHTGREGNSQDVW